mmetsp:Transcript_24479/g.62204  ORF Transcript_24479/g.62204 Transcript_24479/m.62204 type:complete len:291 (+) Transcript_24479:571-1443(+)
MPRGSSVSAQGRTTAYGTPDTRSLSSPTSFQSSSPPSILFILTAGGSCSTSMPGLSGRVTPADDTCTKRGATPSGRYVEMREMGRLKGPGLKAGFSAPSYSNLDSMSWMLDSLAGSRGAPSLTRRARNTGKKAEKGMCTVCHSPGRVSNEWQYATPSQDASGRRIILYRCPSPLSLSDTPSYARRSSGGSWFRQRTDAKPPLLLVDTVPLNTMAGAPPSPAPCTASILDRLTPPITTSSSAPHATPAPSACACSSATPCAVPSAALAASITLARPTPSTDSGVSPTTCGS